MDDKKTLRQYEVDMSCDLYRRVREKLELPSYIDLPDRAKDLVLEGIILFIKEREDRIKTYYDLKERVDS